MVKIIGHRGAPAEEPENTLRSFRRALELGVAGVELDVQPITAAWR
jgi:glycerophosphoryl diester phosphodiesterase